MKFNIKTLALVFFVLIGLFLFAKLYRSKKTDSTFRTELVQIDSASVKTIFLYPKAEKQKEIRFSKNGEQWMVQMDNFTTEADNNSVENLMMELRRIKPERLASKNRDKWVEYQINDTMGTRVQVVGEDNSVMCDLMIGKLNFQQRNQPGMQGMQFGGGRGNVTGNTYVRLTGENEVYVVDGFLPMTFNQGFKNWRFHTVIKCDDKFIKNLSFQYPADSSFTLSMPDSVWMLNGEKADSQKTVNYLNILSDVTCQEFVDGFKPSGSPLMQLTIGGNNMSPIVIQCYNGSTSLTAKGKSDEELFLNSSQNPKIFYDAKKGNILDKLFKGKMEFEIKSTPSSPPNN